MRQLLALAALLLASPLTNVTTAAQELADALMTRPGTQPALLQDEAGQPRQNSEADLAWVDVVSQARQRLGNTLSASPGMARGRRTGMVLCRAGSPLAS